MTSPNKGENNSYVNMPTLHSITLLKFTITLFLSAFLLFSIQPYFSKLVLPRLGGSPGVWSVAMVFFQSTLLLGYAYAHLLTRLLPLKAAVAVHGVVLIGAALFLPLSIASGWETPPATSQELWLLGLFSASIGLPFFAVAANAPLLQIWFSRTGHVHAQDPYFLYGASNIGSFASLYVYILVLEPTLTLSDQSIWWTGGYALLVTGILFCAYSAVKGDARASTRPNPLANKQTQTTRLIPLSRKLAFVVLAAIPSALTVAVTAHISVDVASAPFLWVVPLSLFLLTFVLAFRTKPLMSYGGLVKCLPWIAPLAAAGIFLSSLFSLPVAMAINLGSFFIAALYCHTLLYRLRPHVSRLTEFYLWMSFGGVLGGIFSGLLSAHLFDWIAEYPLLLLLVALLLPPRPGETTKDICIWTALGLCAAAALYAAVQKGWVPAFTTLAHAVVGVMVFVVLYVFVQMKSRSAAAFLLCLTMPVAVIVQEMGGHLFSNRSFFGVIKVDVTEDGTHRIMYHGTTVHGTMQTAALPAPVGHGKPIALAYYHRSSEMADALLAARSNLADGTVKGAVVGLGTGSFLCHSKPDDTWSAYEIDQAVIDLASDPQMFRFISDCAPQTRMVLGDARLTLAAEPDGSVDFLLVDAFSSNAIPAHLMTREAVAVYISKLSANGLLAMHVSNRHLELGTVLAAIAETEGYAIRSARFYRNDDRKAHISSAKVMVLARTEAALGPLLSKPDWKQPRSEGTRPWTDDYSNLLGALLRKKDLDVTNAD